MSANPMDENFTPHTPAAEESAGPQGLVGKISEIIGQLEPGHPAREQLLDLCAELSGDHG
jgi:hypothetical protein